MQVIIVGCGKVGRNLAEQLQAEDIDITLVDTIADKINDLCENIDAMGIVGNGASINTLMEAGVDTADILIAVTASDELNLLCCLIAQKANHCQTIARPQSHLRKRNRFYQRTPWRYHDHKSGTGCCTGNLAASPFSICHQDRYLCTWPCRAS